MKQPELGRKIFELRKEKGFTQEELVEMCNINVRTIQRIESGEVTPRSYTLKNILKALDYEFDNIKTDLENVLRISKTQILLLNLAFWLGIVMIPADSYNIFYESIDYFKIDELHKYFSSNLHLITTVIGAISSFAFYVGFFVIGQIFKNTLIKVSSILLLIVTIISYISTYYSFNWTEEIEVVYGLISMTTLGTVGIPFGIGILKLEKYLDPYAKLTGVFTIIVYGCMITIILGFISLLFYFPVIVMQLILLYKAKEVIIQYKSE